VKHELSKTQGKSVIISCSEGHNQLKAVEIEELHGLFMNICISLEVMKIKLQQKMLEPQL
jgi:hypothetical protein